jgi:beta-glucanase (GH16 family)
MRRILLVAALALSAAFSPLSAQTRELVWSDEFNGATLDTVTWSPSTGYADESKYTARPENISVSSGILHLIARKESYGGFGYTSALIRTKGAASWRYGRIEARIKLPSGAGMVPAFWMMPADDAYGWWPTSGEMDIMENPTTEPTMIYGTAHAQAYSYFTGGTPKSASISVADAESAYHVYALEWSPDSLKFFVDAARYAVVTNDHAGSSSWPFDRPFYVILNLAVGGSWVGSPPAGVVFPVSMDVDYVRVYQVYGDAVADGADFVQNGAKGVAYFAPSVSGASYTWQVPQGATIASGQGTRKISVDFGGRSGDVAVTIGLPAGTVSPSLPVLVSNNLVKNGFFERGAKYWEIISGGGGAATFSLESIPGIAQNLSAKIAVTKASTNRWDIQLKQSGFSVSAGQNYTLKLSARAATVGPKLTMSVLDAATFASFGSTTQTLTNSWKQYSISFKPAASVPALLTIDLGETTGTFFIDSVSVINPAVADVAEGQATQPLTARLDQNYPNPFNPSTTIRYRVGDAGPVHLAVYDLLGRLVATLVDGVREPGEYSEVWDASGSASGVYVARMSQAGRVFSARMILVR